MILIAAVALAVRLAHLAAFDDLAFHRLPFGDSLTYVEEAARLVADGPLGADQPYFQGPLYPLWLAAFRLAGAPLAAVYVAQCLTGTLTVVLVMMVARRLLSTRAALIAGALFALYDAAVFFDVDLLAASLVTTLVMLGLALFPQPTAGSPSRRARLSACLAGAALALAVWGRPNLALPVVALLAWALIRGGYPRATRLALVVSTGVVLLLPMGRNLAASGEPVFIASGGGVNFYIGNHTGATGTFAVPPESGLSNDRRIDVISRGIAARETGREVSAAGASSYWFRRGLAELAADPAAALVLYGRKILLLFNRREIPNHLELDFLRSYSPALAWLPVRAWLLIPLAIGGAILLGGRRALQPLTVFALFGAISVLPFFVTARYRLPLMPIAAVLAGGLIDAALSLRVARAREAPPRWRPVIAGGAIALCLCFLPLLPPSDHVAAHVNLGALHADLGELDEAQRELERALSADPGDPRALENLGALALRQDDPASALGWLERAVSVDPRAFSAWNLRGVALAKSGRFDEALASIERALAIFPESSDAEANLAATWRAYLAHCLERARQAGVSEAYDQASVDRLVDFLQSLGYARAAARIHAAGPIQRDP